MHLAVAVPNITGRLHSAFELISRLEKEGHRVTCLCSEKNAQRIKKQGFSFVEIPEINFRFVDPQREKLSSWTSKFKYHLKNLSNHYPHGKRILHLEEYKNIIIKLGPDRVIADVELHDLIFAAIAAKIKVILFHTWFSNKISSNLPSIRSTIIPGVGFSGSKLGIILNRIKMRLLVYGRLFINKLTFNNYRREVFRKYAKEIGFPRSDMMVNTLPPLYSFNKLPILTLVLLEMEFPHTPAKNLKYVGPMVCENREDDKIDSVTSTRIEAVFSLKQRENKKLIYCSVSSFVKGDSTFLKNVISAVENEKDWLLIMTLGGNISEDIFQPCPSNVFLFNWVPQLKILANADCSINHAGVNSTNECLHFSVPILAYSGKYFDQNGNAARVEYHGIGLRGDKDKDDSKTINKKIFRVLNDSSFKSNIIEMNSKYEEYRHKNLTPLL